MIDLHRLRKPACFAIGLAATACVWEVDRLCAPQASMAIFYLLPIGFVAWSCDGAWSYAMAAACAGAWLHAEVTTGPSYSRWFIPYWNALVYLGFFVAMAAMAGLIDRFRRLSRMEHEMSELKSEMVSLVSHEFANFLTTFKLSLTILEESEGPDDAAQRRKCYASLERVYAHLSGAVANFLNLNRLEAGRFIPHLERTALRTLVHATISQMGSLLEESKVSLRLDFPTEHVVVKADPDALSVVLTNLIGNAFKYTPRDGAVTVRISGEPAGTVLVAVEDTGPGISEADQREIFTGFYRTEAGRKAAKGFGVGLKVTRELLESQGSRLEIESSPGRGSRFFFRLPVWDGKTVPAGSAAPAEGIVPR
jgi:signal transduction histidine kinase